MNDTLRSLFPAFEEELIEDLEKHGQLRELKAGDTLMRTGQYFRSTLLLLSGLVKIFRENGEGEEYFMYYLQPGQACALSMICAARQETSQLMGVAVTDAVILTVPLEYMDRWMTKYKTWYYFVLESYRSRFDELLQTIDHIAFRNMDERLLFYLSKQQKILQTNILTVNHTETAAELNSSREVISRLMKKLADNGHIRLLKNQQVEIIRLPLS